jgi:hypothetical protein
MPSADPGLVATIRDAAEATKESSGSPSPTQAVKHGFEASLSFGQAGWVKQALESALAALESLAGDHTTSAQWLESAQHAVSGIDAQSGLTFQRAAIQDAFRATVDAFAITAEQPSLCSNPEASASAR